MLESDFQTSVILEIKKRLPGCIALKNDANYIQGIPDFLVLYGNKWAALEFKKSEHAKHRPNQDYYVKVMNDMSFARFVYPENREEIINELEHEFKQTLGS